MEALKAIQCELKIKNAKNIQVTNSNGHLFVRCYLSAGKNKRMRLDTQQVSSNGKFSCNESFLLDCIGTKQSIVMIMHGAIVLELRWRSNSLFIGSQLVGRTQVSWRSVFESPKMEIERWVMMKSKNKDVKQSSVRIAMKIETPACCGQVLTEKKVKTGWDETCGCCHGDCYHNTCLDGELFAIEAALEGV